MGASPTQLPPIVTPIADPQTGLPTLPEYTWRQLLLLGRSAWITYTPTTTHLTAITLNDCAFCQLGKLIHVRIGLQGTTDGSTLTVTLPFVAKSPQQTFAVRLVSVSAGSAQIHGTDNLTVDITKFDNTTPVNGTVVNWQLTGAYEAQ